MTTPRNITPDGSDPRQAPERLPEWARKVGQENVALRKGTLRKGVVFNAMGAAAQIVSSIIGTILLARLLDPTDFAAYGIISPIVVTLLIFGDGGTSYITLRSRSLEHEPLSELFSATLIASLIVMPLALAGIGAALWAAGRTDALTPGLLMAVSILTTGLTVQHSAIATRSFRNDLRVLVTIVSSLGALGLSIMLALAGGGLYALVGLFFFRSLITMLMFHVLVGWRPDLRRVGTDTVADLRRLGFFDLTSRGIKSVSAESDKFLAGLLLAPTAAGLYVLAHMLIVTGARQLLQPIQQMLVPYFTEVRRTDHYGGHVLGTFRLFTVIMAPGSLWLALAADDLMFLVMGRQEADLVTAVCVLCLGLSIEIMSRCSGAAFAAADMPKKTVQVQTVVLLVKVGIIAAVALSTAALGQDLTVARFVSAAGGAMVFAGLFRLSMVARTFGLPFPLVFQRMALPYGAAALAMAGVVLAAQAILPDAGLWGAIGRVALGVLGVGAVTMTSVLVFVRDHPIVNDLLAPLTGKPRKRRGRRAAALASGDEV
ncbi:MAG: oligosaccharide flippase family protein [Alphaproteobacteria bacterium]